MQLLEQYQCVEPESAIAPASVLPAPAKRTDSKRVSARNRAPAHDEICKLQMRAKQTVQDVFRLNVKGMDPVEVFKTRQQGRQKKKKKCIAGAPAPMVDAGSTETFVPTAAQQDEMVQVCLQQWSDVARTKLYAQNRQRYRFDYHVLVILKEMVSGFSVFSTLHGEMVVIERNEVAYRCLQQRRDLLMHNPKRGWTSKQLTNSSKLYHMFVGELYPQ